MSSPFAGCKGFFALFDSFFNSNNIIYNNIIEVMWNEASHIFGARLC